MELLGSCCCLTVLVQASNSSPSLPARGGKGGCPGRLKWSEPPKRLRWKRRKLFLASSGKRTPETSQQSSALRRWPFGQRRFHRRVRRRTCHGCARSGWKASICWRPSKLPGLVEACLKLKLLRCHTCHDLLYTTCPYLPYHCVHFAW